MSTSPYSLANVRVAITHYIFGRLLSGIVGIIIVVLLVRHMAVSDYAKFTAAMGSASVIGILSSLGIEKAITRLLPQGRLEQRGDVLSRFIVRMLGLRMAAIAVLTFAVIWGWLYFSKDPYYPGELVLPIAMLMVGVNLFQFITVVLHALVQQIVLARVAAIQWGGRLMLLTLILSDSRDISLKWALYIMSVPEIAGLLVLLLVLWRHLASLVDADASGSRSAFAWPDWRSVRRVMRDNYTYAWLITAPQANSMMVIGAFFLNAPQLAAYGFFVSVVERLRSYLPLQFFLSFAEPVLVAGYVRNLDFDELCRRSNVLYKSNFVAIMFIFTFGITMSPAITKFLTGGRYVEYSFFLPLLIIQTALGSLNSILQVIVNSVGRSEILAKSGCVALFCMGTFFAGATLYGDFSWLILLSPLVFEFVNISATVLLLRRSGFAYGCQTLFHLKVVASSGVGFAAVYWLHNDGANSIFDLVVTATGALLGFATCVHFLQIMTVKDFVQIRRLIGSRNP